MSPTKGIIRLGNKGKLSPRYIGSFEILGKIGPIAHHLALPPKLAHIHNVFHISMLRFFVSDPTHVLDYHPMNVQEGLEYEEKPFQVVDRRALVLRNKVMPLVKVEWKYLLNEKATWEDEMKKNTLTFLNHKVCQDWRTKLL